MGEPAETNEERSTDADLDIKDPDFLETLMKKPMAIRELVGKRNLAIGDYVQAYEQTSKKNDPCKAGEWGQLEGIDKNEDETIKAPLVWVWQKKGTRTKG